MRDWSQKEWQDKGGKDHWRTSKSKVRKFLVMGLRVMESEGTFSGLSPQVKDNI